MPVALLRLNSSCTNKQLKYKLSQAFSLDCPQVKQGRQDTEIKGTKSHRAGSQELHQSFNCASTLMRCHVLKFFLVSTSEQKNITWTLGSSSLQYQNSLYIYCWLPLLCNKIHSKRLSIPIYLSALPSYHALVSKGVSSRCIMYYLVPLISLGIREYNVIF